MFFLTLWGVNWVMQELVVWMLRDMFHSKNWVYITAFQSDLTRSWNKSPNFTLIRVEKQSLSKWRILNLKLLGFVSVSTEGRPSYWRRQSQLVKTCKCQFWLLKYASATHLQVLWPQVLVCTAAKCRISCLGYWRRYWGDSTSEREVRHSWCSCLPGKHGCVS